MQFAINDLGQRVSPVNSGERAFCPLCGGIVIGKCGTIYARHWQHKQDSNCDSWKEHETVWHREWKAIFPEGWQECVIEKNGERHIADIKTPDGLVIEFQNSSISNLEISIREQFYAKMIWVINAELFKNNFDIRSTVSSKLRALDDETALQLRIINRTFKAEVKEIADKLQSVQNKLEERKRDVLKKENKLGIINEYLSKSKEYIDAVITRWINNEIYSDPIITYLVNGINYNAKTQFQSVTKELKSQLEDKRRLENSILEIQGLPDYHFGGIDYKIVEYSKISPQNFQDTKSISKSSMETLFHDVKSFNNVYEFYSMKSKKESFVFIINPEPKLEVLNESILERKQKIRSQELILNTLIEEMRLQLVQELNKSVNKVVSEIEALNIELDEIDSRAISLLEEHNDLNINLDAEMNYTKDDIINEHVTSRVKIKMKNKGLYSFDWKHERRSWQAASQKIYFDIGEDYLFEKISNDELRKISKEEFKRAHLSAIKYEQEK